jgi:protein MpaA
MALLVAVSTAAGHARRVHLGKSVDGRPIVAYEVGDTDSPRRELVVGCIHGNEQAGVAIARKLEQASPPGIDLWIVPVLNPDGLRAYPRGNAHGVDLNRTFPWRWRPLRGLFYSGPAPLSEPESRIAFRLIRRLHPQVSIWFHQHLDVVDKSGGSAAIEERFADLVGLRLVQLPREPGSVVGWENHRFVGTTAFVVELPAGHLSPRAVGRFARAVLGVGAPGSRASA